MFPLTSRLRFGLRYCTYTLSKRRSSQHHGICWYTTNYSRKLRGPTAQDVSYFRSILARPDKSVLDGTATHDVMDELQKYNIDWTKHYQGSSDLVLRPQTTSEVSSILKYCHENYIGITPQGGNTSLCGAATPISNEIILSMEYMKRIYKLDEYSGILTCDAGCILQSLHDYAKEAGYLFPLDIGSKGTCHIGGNVSTNAGGHHFFRFGGLHGTVVGMEVVLADGRVLRMNIDANDDDDDNDDDCTHRFQYSSASLRKDNTGYDLKQLFIGGEGTLGIITKVAVACPSLPMSKNVALLVCGSYSDVLQVLKATKEELGETLSAIELIDWNTMKFVQEYGSGIGESLISELLSPGATNQPLFILVESQGCDPESDSKKMDAFLTGLYELSAIENGFLAQDSTQINQIWGIRENCNPSVARAGFVHKFDVSIGIESYMEVAEEVRVALNTANLSNLTVCVWGHVADGNAHINIVSKQFDKDVATAERIENIVYSSVMKRRGSISAEHGIGQSKRKYMHQIKDGAVLELMSQMKNLFDPHSILNPGKYLPEN
jgi:FAD/FMN-containing dehydrogenase